MSSNDGGASPPHRTDVDLDWRSVAIASVALTALGGVTAALAAAPRTTSALGVSLVIGLGLAPVVGAIQVKLRIDRTAAVAIVLVTGGVVFAAFAALILPRAVDEVGRLSDDLPGVVADLERLPIIGDDLAQRDVPQRVQTWIDELPDRLGRDSSPIEAFARAFATGLLTLAIVFVFVVAFLIDGPRLARSWLAHVPPERRAFAERVGDVAYRVVGRYVAGSLLVAGMAATFVLVYGLILGVPLAPLAAMWVLLTNLIPQIGGALGGIPFVVLGFTESPGIGVATLVGFLLWQQLENHVIAPLIVGQAVKLSPPTTMVGALVGASAGGVVGALIAVPLIGATKALWIEFGPYRPPAAIDEAGDVTDRNNQPSTSASSGNSNTSESTSSE